MYVIFVFVKFPLKFEAILVIFLFSVLRQTQEIPQSLSLTTANIGDTVSLHCAASIGTSKVLYWYKQSLGYVPQVVASTIYGMPTIHPPYKLRLTLVEGKLTMSDAKKEDEANYFCQQGIDENKNWNSGTFLSVNGKNQRFNIMSKDLFYLR